MLQRGELESVRVLPEGPHGGAPVDVDEARVPLVGVEVAGPEVEGEGLEWEHLKNNTINRRGGVSIKQEVWKYTLIKWRNREPGTIIRANV